MKKIATLLLACVLMVGCLSSALAVNATYNEGKITVTTGLTGFFEIWIDGVGSGYWVGTGRPSNTFSFELADGQHTVRLYSPDGDQGESNVFWAGTVPVDPTLIDETEETEQTVVEAAPVTVEELTAKLIERVAFVKAAVAKEATCTEKGQDSDGNAIPALGHLYRADNTNDKNEYRCVRCGATTKAAQYSAMKDRLGSIVTDADNNTLSYQAYAKQDAPKVYYVKPDKSGDLTLSLDSNVIVTLLREGYDKIAFVNGNAELVVNLNQISKKWFDTAEKIYSYKINTYPAGEATLVNIYVETDTELVGATYILDVQLNGVDLFLNGVY